MKLMNVTSKKREIGVALVVFLVLISVFSTDVLQAQSKGQIRGCITDSNTGDLLPGANIMLEGTTFGTASDRRGDFRFANIPPGTYTLKVRYMGYEDYSAQVSVTVSQTVNHDVSLEGSYVELEGVVVQGIRQGQVKALSLQKTAPNIKNVVAAEQMRRFPDLNTAEVLQRIPSVSITRDQGEGRYVLVRGMEARLNSMSVNGDRIASPENEERFVGLDVISTNQIASIEVTKTITPDMDGDAIGGAINMVTKSAFDYVKRILHVTAGSGYGNLMGKPLYQGAFTFADRFGADRNIGFTLSGNFYRSDRGSDNNEMEWGSEDDVDDNEIPWALQDLQLRDYFVKRDRFGISSSLDYHISNNHQLFLRGMFNQRDDTELRHRLRIRPDKGDYNSATSISGAVMERALKDRLETQNIYNVAGGGKHQFDKFDLDFTLSYSYAKEEKPDQTDPAFELNEDVDLTLNLSDPDLPTYTITNLASGYEHNAANWVLDEYVYEELKSTNSDLMGALNIKFPFALSSVGGELKFGAKFQFQNKDRDNETWEYGWEGDDDVLMSQMIADDEDDNFLDNAYRIGPSVDSEKSRAFFKANRDILLEGELNREDSDAENYEATENIIASYGMSTFNFGKMMVLAGFRLEMTSIDYTGNEVLFDDEGDYESTKQVKNDDSYSHFLPMIHFRYNLTPQTNFRAAFTSGIARPNYYHLVPFKIVLTEDEEMVIGNPDLVPTTAYSFDLLGEHYFQGIGIVSGGFFYKSLDKIIFTKFFEETSGPYAGYEVEQPTNGETASLYGIEVNWQQQLTFLPGFWKGFGIYANYTYTKSEADLPDRESISLPGQAGNVGNFAISYEKYGFAGRVGLNYHGNFIEEVGKDEDHDIYYDNHLQFDFSLSQRISPGVRVYVEGINMNNEPLRYYIGKETRPIAREFYSWWMHVGLKFEF